MHSTVCTGCHVKIPNSDLRRTFQDDLLVDCIESNDILPQAATKKHIKLYSGIEIITGQKIYETVRLTGSFCEACFNKLETLLNFRTQLLLSVGQLYKPLTNNKNTGILSTSNSEDNDIIVCESKDTLIRNNVQKNLENRFISDNVINLADISMPSFTLQNEEYERHDSIDSNKVSNEQDNNLNLSDISNSSDEREPPEVLLKIEKNDIESDIDVCSGEDDEILELDIQNNKNEPVEISSSSESDIEVCDYEPSGKRIKDYNAVSLPVRF